VIRCGAQGLGQRPRTGSRDSYEIKSKPVIGVDPEMDICYCTQLFDRFGLSYAPVIDKGGELKGIVSYANMVLRGLCRLTQGS